MIRHALSEANNRNNIGTMAFASADAHLMPEGQKQARHLGDELLMHHGINPPTTRIAISELRRTAETAERAGFRDLQQYSELNEVVHGLEPTVLRKILDDGELPSIALERARVILENRPKESIWLTHGMVIAALCRLMGVYKDARLIPRFCEIRTLPL